MNNKQYYVTLPDKAQEGPYDEKALIARYQAGKYPEGTLVWCEGMENWEPIANLSLSQNDDHENKRPSLSVGKRKQNFYWGKFAKKGYVILACALIFVGYTTLKPQSFKSDKDIIEFFDTKLEYAKSVDISTWRQMIKHRPEVVRALSGTGNKKAREITFLGMAALGSIEGCQYLLDKGFEIDSNYPLEVAAAAGHLEVCKFLISQGLEPSHNALASAALTGRLQICQYLVEQGANGSDDRLLSFLLQRDEESYKDTQKMLRCIGQDVSIIELKNRVVDVAKYFVSLGADPNDHTVVYCLKNETNANTKLKIFLESQQIKIK